MDSHPVDTPIQSTPPGKTHKESDFHGDARHGFGQGLGGDTAIGAEKGNLVTGGHDSPRPLTHGGSPLKNRRKR